MPLETLDAIAWKYLKDGDDEAATYFPDAIRALLSANPFDRDAARDMLFERASGCPEVYPLVVEPSARMVPFLVEVLAEPDVRDAGLLLEQLAELYQAKGYTTQHMKGATSRSPSPRSRRTRSCKRPSRRRRSGSRRHASRSKRERPSTSATSPRRIAGRTRAWRASTRAPTPARTTSPATRRCCGYTTR